MNSELSIIIIIIHYDEGLTIFLPADPRSEQCPPRIRDSPRQMAPPIIDIGGTSRSNREVSHQRSQSAMGIRKDPSCSIDRGQEWNATRVGDRL